MLNFIGHWCGALMWYQKKPTKKTEQRPVRLRRVFVAIAIAMVQWIVNSLSVVMCVLDWVTQKPSALCLDCQIILCRNLNDKKSHG